MKMYQQMWRPDPQQQTFSKLMNQYSESISV